MRSIPRLLLSPVLVASIALGACAETDPNEVCNDKIVTRVNPSTDFATIKTFAVIDEADYPEQLPGDLPYDVDRSVFAANRVARASLISQGLTEVDPEFETPDVWLFSLAATKTKMGYTWDCVPGYAWWGWSWDWSYCSWFQEVPVTYEVGTVIIGLAKVTDDQNGEVVFGGAVQGVFNCEDSRERLERAVQKIFADYPG